MEYASSSLALLGIIFINIILGIYGFVYKKDSRVAWFASTCGWAVAFLQAWITHVK